MVLSSKTSPKIAIGPTVFTTGFHNQKTDLQKEQRSEENSNESGFFMAKIAIWESTCMEKLQVGL
jgi:pseudouridine-5'-phosphate glycosidase